MAASREALLNAQLGVIGSMLIDDRTVGIALQALKPEYFDSSYRTIFEAMRGLFQVGRPVDAVTVLGQIGEDYTDLLRQIIELTPTAANIKAYIADLRRQARIRLMQEAASEILSADNEDDIRQMLDRINAVMVDRPGVRTMTMQDALTDFYKRHDPAVKPVYLPWKFEKLNDHLRTMRGDFGIIGGYPSDGKTTLALATAREQAKTKKVGFFSFETDCEKLADAMISAAAQIGLPKIQLNAMNDHDWDTLAAISADFGGRNLDLIEAAGMTAGDMLSAEADEWEGRSVLESLYAAGTSAELTAELERYSLSFAERLRQRRSTINPSVRRMVEIVEKQYSRELTIRGMAEQFNANPVYLGRLFKEETGQSFTAFLNQVRIREAKRQLLETDKTVAAIASSVGYLSQGYFTNLFKKSVGCFPREYRLRRR